MRFAFTRRVVGVALAVAALGLGACGGDDDSGGGSSGGGGNEKIALLLPESHTARYEAQDRPDFTAALKSECPDCQLLYSNAQEDASKQQSQAEAAITNGAKVLVLDPVDSASAASIVTRAKQSNIPVISYDRLILNSDVDSYVAFDSVQVGKLQAQALLDALGGGKGKTIVMINGDPADNNAKLFKQGAHSVFDKSGVKIAKEYDTPGWLGAKAQTEMDQAITAVGKSNIDGVYAANDTLGGAAIAAMKGAGIDPSKVPVTGQDAELAGIQRIVAGTQYMTINKPIKPLATAASKLAVATAQGKEPPSGMINSKTNNGQKDVPTVLIDVEVVKKDNVQDTVIKEGVYTVNQICTPAYASACKAAGIQ